MKNSDKAEINEVRERLKYLRKVAETTEDIYDIHEIFNYHILLKEILNSGIDDTEIKSEVADLENEYSTLIDSISDDKIDKLLNSEKNTSGEFNGQKGNNSNNKVLSYLNSYVTEHSGLIIAMIVIFMCLVTGTIDKILNIPFSGTSGTVNAIYLTTKDFFVTVIHIMSFLILLKIICKFALDTIYISNPSFEEHIMQKYVSKDAIRLVREYNISNEPNKITRSIEMLKLLTEKYPDNADLKELNNTIENERGKSKYYAIVRVEYIYEQDMKGKQGILVQCDNK